MSYFPDLSPYTYKDAGIGRGALNVGWLDRASEFKTGDAPKAFIDRLWNHCCFPVVTTRGFHRCNLCRGPQRTALTVRRGDRRLKLGTAEIRVFGTDGTTYACPDLVFHYVMEHNYLPPDGFITAVLAGAVPGSPQYMAALETLGIS